MDSIGIGVAKQQNSFVSATLDLKAVADVGSNRIDHCRQKGILPHRRLAGADGVERFALNGQDRLKGGIAQTDDGARSRVPFDHEKLGLRTGTVIAAVDELDRLSK